MPNEYERSHTSQTRDENTPKPTEEFFPEHAQLLPGEALTSEGGKLPAEDLGELAPGGPRWVTEEGQVLRVIANGKIVLKLLIRSHMHISPGCYYHLYHTVILIIFLKQPGRRLTLGSSVRRLYHTTDAQPPGSWLTLEMTTNGREEVWKDWHTL